MILQIILKAFVFLQVAQSGLRGINKFSTQYNYIIKTWCDLVCIFQISQNTVSSLCAVFCFTLQIIYVYSFWMEMNKRYYQLNQKENQLNFGALYEGLILNRNKLSKYYNLIIIIKKCLQMGFLVMLYNLPCFQIAFVLLLDLSLSIYIYFVKPMENQNEFYKQLVTQISLSVIQCLILFFGYNEINQIMNQQISIIFGWFIIGLSTIIIIVQLLFDIKQQIIFLQGKYNFFYNIIEQFNRIKRRFRRDDDNTIESEQSELQIKKIQQNQMQRQTITRRLVAFNLQEIP